MLISYRFKLLNTIIGILFNIFYQYIFKIPQTDNPIIELFYSGYSHIMYAKKL